MAAPPDKTTSNLSGLWALNKKLSDSADLGLQIQGVGYLIRSIIHIAYITIKVHQYEAPPKAPSTVPDSVTHIDIDQSAPGVSPSKELRCLDGLSRDHSDWLFGDVKDQTRWISQEEIEDNFLKSGWLTEDKGKDLICSHAISEKKEWTATQIWGFQTVNGERRYCRNIVILKEKQRAEFRFVYDWQENLAE